MRMELIQPFINAADAVFSGMLTVARKDHRSLHGRRNLSPQRGGRAR